MSLFYFCSARLSRSELRTPGPARLCVLLSARFSGTRACVHLQLSQTPGGPLTNCAREETQAAARVLF